MPDARQRSSSPFMALAVTATIGVRTALALGFGGAQPPRQLMAVHARHVDVERARRRSGRRCPRLQRIDAVRRAVGGDPQQLELQHKHLAVHGMIVDHQDARTIRLAARRRSQALSAIDFGSDLERRVGRRRMKCQRHSEGGTRTRRALDCRHHRP